MFWLIKKALLSDPMIKTAKQKECMFSDAKKKEIHVLKAVACK